MTRLVGELEQPRWCGLSERIADDVIRRDDAHALADAAPREEGADRLGQLLAVLHGVVLNAGERDGEDRAETAVRQRDDADVARNAHACLGEGEQRARRQIVVAEEKEVGKTARRRATPLLSGKPGGEFVSRVLSNRVWKCVICSCQRTKQAPPEGVEPPTS